MKKFSELLKLLDDIIIECIFQPLANSWYALTDRSQYWLAAQCFIGIGLCFVFLLPGLGVIEGQISPQDIFMAVIVNCAVFLFVNFLAKLESDWRSGNQGASTFRLFWRLRIGVIFWFGYLEFFRITISPTYELQYFFKELKTILFVSAIYLVSCCLPPPSRSKFKGGLVWQA